MFNLQATYSIVSLNPGDGVKASQCVKYYIKHSNGESVTRFCVGHLQLVRSAITIRTYNGCVKQCLEALVFMLVTRLAFTKFAHEQV